MNLLYRRQSLVEDLAVGECTIRRCARPTGFEWWELWFRVLRATDQQPQVFAVALIVGSRSDALTDPKGTDGWMVDAWGLNKTAPDVWQVSPSINVLNLPEPRIAKGHLCRRTCPGQLDVTSKACVVCGGPYVGSLWHQTPAIVGVPPREPWMP